MSFYGQSRNIEALSNFLIFETLLTAKTVNNALLWWQTIECFVKNILRLAKIHCLFSFVMRLLKFSAQSGSGRLFNSNTFQCIEGMIARECDKISFYVLNVTDAEAVDPDLH